MRCALIFGLVACWLAVLGLHAHSRKARHAALAERTVVAASKPAPEKPVKPQPRPAKPSTIQTEPMQTWIVVSDGKQTQKDALENALEKACRLLLTELNDLTHTDRGDATVDADYVRRQLWKDLRKAEMKREDVGEEFTNGHWILDKTVDDPLADVVGEAHEVSIKIGVSPQDRADLLQIIHKHRMEDRMLGLGKVLGVVVLLLGGISGYLRLDEWTKGYYTTWLRLGVLGLIGIAGMGYWLLP